MRLRRQRDNMNIKDEILREVKRNMKEASTIRIGEEDINFSDKDTSNMKDTLQAALEDITIIIKRTSKGTISEEEATKQAKSFVKNYLKGVYGK